jgi:hypothetical protein
MRFLLLAGNLGRDLDSHPVLGSDDREEES